jgi:eukaryotic-like serine/threonine-protein kinase
LTPDRWSEIQHQLDVALSLTIVERKTFLQSIGTKDLELRHELESLLRGETADPDFMNTPALSLLQNSLPESPSSPSSISGRILGAYRVIDLLGTGGMGEVYRAVRADGHYDQQVAVKIVRPGMGGEFSSIRFRNERQILAKLDHPMGPWISTWAAQLQERSVTWRFRMELTLTHIDDQACQWLCSSRRR